MTDHAMKRFFSFEDMKAFVAYEENLASILTTTPKNELFTLCLEKHEMENLYTLPIGDFYGLLEWAAGLRRGDVILGVKELEEAFNTLAN